MNYDHTLMAIKCKVVMKSIFLGLIKLYQLCISPFLGKCCRFYPSCSEYAEGAIRKHGVVKGGWLAVKRVVKCHPWHRGGVDEVP